MTDNEALCIKILMVLQKLLKNEADFGEKVKKPTISRDYIQIIVNISRNLER